MSDETGIDICETFCTEIENAGYYAGIYASLHWLNTKINSSKLDRFNKWVAQWNTSCEYRKSYGMWQYSNAGKVNGINGNVYLDYAIYDYLNIIKNANLNHPNKIDGNITYYTVKAGDNLSTIAEQYNMTWQELYNINKNVFPKITAKYNEKSYFNVKWCIEQVINTMYNNTKLDIISKYFNLDYISKPSLKLIIYTIVCKYERNNSYY